MYSLIGGLVGGFVSGAFITVRGIFTFSAGILVAGIVSGKDAKLLYRILGLPVFYLVAALSMILHTAIFQSNAVFGIIALIYYSIFIIPVYFVVGMISRKILSKRVA